MNTEVINIAKKMLAEAELEKALDYLLEIDQNSHEILMLRSQLGEWNKKNNLGLIADNTERERIRWATINMLTNIQLNQKSDSSASTELLVLSDIIEENILSINNELSHQDDLDHKAFRDIEWLASSYPKEYLYLISRISEYHAFLAKEKSYIKKLKRIEEFVAEKLKGGKNAKCFDIFIPVMESNLQFAIYKSVKRKTFIFGNTKWAKFLSTEFKKKQLEIEHTVDILHKKKIESIFLSFAKMPEKFLFWREILKTFDKRRKIFQEALDKLERRHNFITSILTGGGSAVLTQNYVNIQHEIRCVNSLVIDLKENIASIPDLSDNNNINNIELYQYDVDYDDVQFENLSQLDSIVESESSINSLEPLDISDIETNMIHEAIEIINNFYD